MRRYCADHPDMPALTLARLIESGPHGDRFSSINAIRMGIRLHRGKRKNGSGKTTDKPVAHNTDSSTVRSDYRAPLSYGEDRSDLVIHGAQRILRLSDIHFPIHDPEAINAALDYGCEHDPTVVLLDGDIMDIHDLSFHERTTMRSYLMAEVQMLVEFLDALRAMFPKARIIFKEGNHEERVRRWFMAKAPELMATDCFDLPAFVSFLSKRPDAFSRVEWVTGKRIIRCGHLAMLHGHEFKGGGGVNPARWLFLRTGENAICGHFHRTSEHSEPSLSGEQRGAWSTGCLCHLSPDYMRHNKWNHGFAWIEVEQAGTFRVKNIRIIDGKIR